ncbi:Lin1244/Lin1753 domain-containing protein [Enterococcus wangshanyuanii]|uniref:DNA damage-inducible protein DnaD n=1 Tax=Enterococcus wangshanyuanii TaxID=2005703 RepID=A0ABQ1PSB9_9ENTE|nr:Lin1244/Lin1753 domain-containing protein [Enterococcus wangshanyuanii]GGD02282.1 DNA damage-inducible protein DnaD [Enterococcus wangshanyuanii]
MARPTKKGIDYFPLDVDFLKDIKVRKIKRACGPFTVEVLICLLGNIYRENGYYIGWDEDTSFLVADEVGAKEGLVEEIVKKAVQVNFFNHDKFENHQILTSKGIQERYIEATKKRKEVVIEDIYRVNDTLKGSKTIVNANINTQSKVKESKVNKSKVNENKKDNDSVVSQSSDNQQFLQQPFGSDKLGELISYYSKNVSRATPVNITDLEYDLNDFNGDLELMKDAVNICARENKRTYNYFSGILKRWRATGVKTHDDYVDSERKWQEEKQAMPKPSYRQPVRQETIPKNIANPIPEQKLSAERQAELKRQLEELGEA